MHFQPPGAEGGAGSGAAAGAGAGDEGVLLKETTSATNGFRTRFSPKPLARYTFSRVVLGGVLGGVLLGG